MNEEIRQLVHKRGQIKSQITRSRTHLVTCTGAKDVSQLRLRLAKIENTWQEFDIIQSQIEVIDESEEQAEERINFETSYFNIVAEINDFIERYTHANVPATDANYTGMNVTAQPSTEIKIADVKLPTINLPTFNGSYQEWVNFFETFRSLIHDNFSLNQIQKFHYLKSSLRGEAVNIIQSLELTSDNYLVAWNLLRDRYENKKLIVQCYVKNIFDLPNVVKESSIALRMLTDGLMKNIRALEAIGQPVNTWDALINHIVFSKLDSTTQRAWECTVLDDKLPTLNDITSFLNQRCRILESIETNKNTQINKPNINTNKCNKINTYLSTTSTDCKICNKSHPIYACDEFRKLSPAERIQEVKRLKLCLNCLKDGHFSSDCKFSYCRKCSKRHNTMLHLDGTNINEQSQVRSNEPNQVVSTHCASNNTKQVILSTALIIITDYQGNNHECRALLDTGSQSNFITAELSQKLKLKHKNINSPVSGIGQSVTNIKQQTAATIKSRLNGYRETLKFLILPKITENLPNVNLNISHLNIPNTIKLADYTFHRPGKIDVLIGADTFYDLLCVGQIKLSKGEPILQKTKLGWVISGNLNHQHTTHTVCNLNITNNIDIQMKKFWEIEETENDKLSLYSKEEIACENLYMATTTRDNTGRFTVNLPFRENVNKLGQSEEIAQTRLLALERKLHNNIDLRVQYNTFMREYEDLGHMSLVPKMEIQNQPNFYLPHHAVFKEDSATTKTRVVFDGSAKTTSGVSLNDILNVGPTIQDNLFEIIVRFRTHRYVLTADVAKMYRQINICEHQRDFQRILWRYDTNEPIQHYRLNTVTYGTSAAPFLAIRSLKQLCIEEANNYRTAAKIAERDFYVDDLLTGAETTNDIYNIRNELISMFKAGNMELRKWSTNNQQLANELPDNEANMSKEFGQNEGKKTLGLIWNPQPDNLTYSIKLNKGKVISKRTILSTIAQIYDPLGLVGPITIRAKILLQKLWQLKLTWDESVPIEIHTLWTTLNSELSNLNQLRVPRHVMCNNSNILQMHAFSDASEAAYGACIYIRASDNNGRSVASLLCAKSKVAPLKNITLPRLELCGAVLAVKLAQRVKSALNINITETFFWTDSSIVLAWIKTPPNKLKTFVANRVASIQQTIDAQWNHVRSRYNPADVISRGTNPENLMKNDQWWKGPEWLRSNPDKWPEFHHINDQCTDEITMSEMKQIVSCIAINRNDYMNNILSKYSSFNKLQRIIAYCYRFCTNAKTTNNKGIGNLTTNEIQQSTITILINLQKIYFKEEWADLKKGNLVKKGSKLKTLSPFIDNDGLIRVGGRLSKSDDISQDQKHPIVLPGDHIITKNILREEHISRLHCGCQALLATIRLKYWPLRGKYLAKKVIHECLICFRHRPKPTEYKMGDLPRSRITGGNRPFTITGVDYCGPFQIKESRTRGRPKLTKGYVSIFICFATKAVHLELVSDLTTEAFLGALRRFTARRGLCSDIHSDNGTNFVGASRQLREPYEFLSKQRDNIAYELTKQNINWHFNPPRSPHFGGLWESAVKSFKHHFNRITKNITLTYEEFNTLITQIEACLNSRPITSLSIDPNDLYVLTPSHFLIGDSLVSPSESDSRSTPTNLLSRWQHLQKMRQHFWQRWSREYLNNLQQRTKWSHGAHQLKIGTLVLLIDDNLPPQKWIIGRIIALQPGSDSIIRVVSVKTASGIYSRSARKVCALPSPEDEELI